MVLNMTRMFHRWLGGVYEVVSKSFRTESITKYTLTFGITRWEATQRVMTAKLTRLTHKIAIQLHLVAESCTVCSSRSRRSVRELLDIPSYIPQLFIFRGVSFTETYSADLAVGPSTRQIPAVLMRTCLYNGLTTITNTDLEHILFSMIMCLTAQCGAWKFYSGNKIELLCLPSHTIHVIHPLQCSLFKPV
jgi:hypothetical protein